MYVTLYYLSLCSLVYWNVIIVMSNVIIKLQIRISSFQNSWTKYCVLTVYNVHTEGINKIIGWNAITLI